MAWHVFRGSRLNERGLTIIWTTIVKDNEKQCHRLCLQGSCIFFRVPGTWFLKTFIHPVYFILPM